MASYAGGRWRNPGAVRKRLPAPDESSVRRFPGSRASLAVAVVLLALLAGAWAPGARADVAVIPDDQALPWTDPAHSSPLEQLLSSLASRIVERPARVLCLGDSEWATVSAAQGLDPASLLGFVPTSWYPSLGAYAEDATEMYLSPQVCLHLWLFAKAQVKPTKCPTTKLVTETVSRTEYRWVKVRVKQRKRVRVSGKWVTKT